MGLCKLLFILASYIVIFAMKGGTYRVEVPEHCIVFAI